jgi:hypothetical protein
VLAAGSGLLSLMTPLFPSSLRAFALRKNKVSSRSLSETAPGRVYVCTRRRMVGWTRECCSWLLIGVFVLLKGMTRIFPV